jgi:hypothetical protein
VDPWRITAGDRALGAVMTGGGALGAVMTGGGAPHADSDGLDDTLDTAAYAADVVAVRRLLDAGAPVDRVAGAEHNPLGQACWRGHPEVVRELVSRGARLTWVDSSPIGAALHGSRHCHDPQGGPTMKTVWEGAPEPLTMLSELGVNVA